MHAITPLEENKSFLEKVIVQKKENVSYLFNFFQVEFGERLCGIAEDESFIIERLDFFIILCSSVSDIISYSIFPFPAGALARKHRKMHKTLKQRHQRISENPGETLQPGTSCFTGVQDSEMQILGQIQKLRNTPG